MTPQDNIIHKFYTAFSTADSKTMCECYHPDIQFRDPVFGLLKGSDVCKMWQMLIQKSKGNIKIEFSDLNATEYTGTVNWKATYYFSKTNKKVINKIQSHFHFQDGLIIKQDDYFDLWKWSKQAFGLIGIVVGWTGFFQKKIQNQALLSLQNYTNKKTIS